MQEKIIFREMLSGLKTYADSKNNHLTQKEIKDFFADAHLEEGQYEFIYEYLESQKITVEGYHRGAVKKEDIKENQDINKNQDTNDTECEKHEEEIKTSKRASEEDAFLKLYLSDMEENQMEVLDEKTELDLYHQAAEKDPMAKSRLIEWNLRRVYDLVMRYEHQELPKSDLIQEGNIGLILGMDGIPKQKTLTGYHGYIHTKIRQALDEAVQAQRDRKRMDQQIVGQVNFLNEAIKNLEQDLERKVGIEELSAYIEMPIQEIKDILKMAGDDIEIEKEHHNHS